MSTVNGLDTRILEPEESAEIAHFSERVDPRTNR